MKLKELHVLMVGDNGCWGKGRTIAEAKKRAYSPSSYTLYIVHPDTYVDQLGRISWVVGDEGGEDDPNAPVLIDWKGKGVNKKKVEEEVNSRMSIDEYHSKENEEKRKNFLISAK